MYYRYSNPTQQGGIRSDYPLTDKQIEKYAPSVLATAPHSSRSEHYSFIPTIQVLNALRSEGFQPFEVRQTLVRDTSKVEHTRHMVRLRHPDAVGGDRKCEAAEIILLNSHDGTSSYQLLAGWFRMVCSNGLIAGNINTDIRIPHRGNVIGNVIEGSYQIVKNIEAIDSQLDSWKGITLDSNEQLAFAKSVEQLRWGDESPLPDPMALLQARRHEDAANTLWDTFNKAQENLIKGDLRGRSRSGRATSTRSVSGVNQNVRLNQALWTLADSMAKLKNGKQVSLVA